MKRIENPHVAARRGKPPSNKEHSRNYSSPEKNICLAYRRFRHQGHHAIPCLQLSLNGRPGTYSSTEHGFATLFQNAPDSPASQQFTSDGRRQPEKRHHQELPHLAGRIRTKRKIPRHKDHFFPCTPAIFRNLPASRNPVAAQRKEMAAPASMAHGEWAPNTLKELFSHALTASPPR